MLKFDNSFVRELPADPESENFRRQVTGACYSRVLPTPVKNPQLVAYSKELAAQLGLSADFCASPEFPKNFSGNELMPGMEPYAMCYGGHQFGNWAGQLGDGRAINLGEILDSNGQRQTLQLKGAGATPYSRTADGLAVMRSSVREFLCSEAMFHLGVPTTRALSLVNTGESVVRDMFYDGNPQREPGAVVCRVAPSFIRFGNFEILAARGEHELLKRLLDYTIDTYFPKLTESYKENDTDRYLAWFEEVCQTTLEMILGWMRVGFVHGVMNTDNMSVHGLTIDYGPYGWLEDFDPEWTPNTTDAQGRRYRYSNQPGIAQWNLLQLANALFPLINAAEPLQRILEKFSVDYTVQYQKMMASKLGLKASLPQDESLVDELLSILPLAETDMTIFFRQLANLEVEYEYSDDELIKFIEKSYYTPDKLSEQARQQMIGWLKKYQQRLADESSQDAERKAAMNAVNPKYVLRNYLAQLAIDKAEQGDNLLVNELLDVLRKPYDEQPGKETFAEKRPEWARNRPGCSMLSCSS